MMNVEINACVFCGADAIASRECDECYAKDMAAVMASPEYDAEMSAWEEAMMFEAMCAEYDSRSYDEPVHFEIA